MSLPLTAAAKRAIAMWRAAPIVLLHLDEERFARSFESFQANPCAANVGEFDSSLEGSGVLIYQRARDESETILGGGAVSLTSLAFADDSSHQNITEFIGAIMVVVVMSRMGIHQPKKIMLWLRGDSIAALTWATKSVSESSS